MKSHHIIYDITCTVFMTSLPLYLKRHPPYLSHHNVSIDGLRPTLCRTSHQPYVCHLIHFTQLHIHNLWLHTIVVFTLHPLHSWDIKHNIYDITHMAIKTLYLPSDSLYLTLHPLYLSHQTQGITYTTPTPCMTSHTLNVWHPIQYACYHNNCLWHCTPMYNITPNIFMTSYPICALSTYCLHDNTMTIRDISPFIFDTTATVSVSSHKWHTHLYQCSAVLMTSQQVCKSSHLAHVWHHTQSTSHHMHTLWHQWLCSMTSQSLHSWHQISSIWHHIHSLGHYTLYVWHQVHCIWPHVHCICVITPTLSMTSQPLYGWYHIQYICDVIPLYLGHNIH